MKPHINNLGRHRKQWTGENFSNDMLRANQQPTGKRRK
jgi:hypothetical protein